MADCVGAIASRLAPVKTIATVYVWADYDWKRNMIQAIDKVVPALVRQSDSALRRYTAKERQIGAFSRWSGHTDLPGSRRGRVAMCEQERQRRRRDLGVADDEIVLGNVARLYPEKAHDSLLRCFKTILSQHPQEPALDLRCWAARTRHTVAVLDPGAEGPCEVSRIRRGPSQ